jgi:SAM-dependent methyltransferase
VTRLSAAGPNREQIDYWNDNAGRKWVTLGDLLDLQLARLGEATMDQLGVGPGESVLDVGCGCGATTVELARRVGADGSVTGIDISTVMLERAAGRPLPEGAGRVAFVNADAQTAELGPAASDAVFSRFGVMFFADPVAAFANLRRALVPGGRIGFVCWQDVGANPWVRVPLLAVAPLVELPPPPEPGAPGPFAFADRQRVERILAEAGFDDIAFGDLAGELLVGGGGDLERTVDFTLEIGPVSRVLADADDAVRERARAAVLAALAPHATGEGVRLGYAATLVTAGNPAR